MAAYDSYKDSDVKWLGKVPGLWEVKKLRAFFERRIQKVSSLDFSPLSVTKNGVVPQMENVAKSGDTDNRRLVKIGDFVINSRSDRKGSSGLSELEGSVSFVNTIMTPNNRILPKFCNYLLKSNAFVVNPFLAKRIVCLPSPHPKSKKTFFSCFFHLLSK